MQRRLRHCAPVGEGWLLPNTRTRADGVIEIAVADLVAAGKLDPLGDAATSGDGSR